MTDHTQEILDFLNTGIAAIKFAIDFDEPGAPLEIESDEPGFKFRGFPSDGFDPAEALKNYADDLNEQLVHWLVGRISKGLRAALLHAAERASSEHPLLQLWTGQAVHPATLKALRSWRLVHVDEWSEQHGGSLTPLGGQVARELARRKKEA